MTLPVRPLLLALQGSPRRQGSTARLLSSFLADSGPCRVQQRHLPSLQILPCRGCGRCGRGRVCPQQDTMPKLLNLFHHAEALVLAAPVYFYGFPAQVKAVIDRCQPIWHTRSQIRKKRPAFFISTCASENPKEFQVIVREAKAFLNTLGFIYQDDLLVPGMDSPDSAARLVQACGEARRKGIDFVNRAFQI